MEKIERYKQILEEVEYRKELAELAEKIDLSKATIRKYLTELKDRGLVKRLRKGIYKRTAEGTDWLESHKVQESEDKQETEGDKQVNLEGDIPQDFVMGPLFNWEGIGSWIDENPGKVELGLGVSSSLVGAGFFAGEKYIPALLFFVPGFLASIDGFLRWTKGKGVWEFLTEEEEVKEEVATPRETEDNGDWCRALAKTTGEAFQLRRKQD